MTDRTVTTSLSHEDGHCSLVELEPGPVRGVEKMEEVRLMLIWTTRRNFGGPGYFWKPQAKCGSCRKLDLETRSDINQPEKHVACPSIHTAANHIGSIASSSHYPLNLLPCVTSNRPLTTSRQTNDQRHSIRCKRRAKEGVRTCVHGKRIAHTSEKAGGSRRSRAEQTNICAIGRCLRHE